MRRGLKRGDGDEERQRGGRGRSGKRRRSGEENSKEETEIRKEGEDDEFTTLTGQEISLRDTKGKRVQIRCFGCDAVGLTTSSGHP